MDTDETKIREFRELTRIKNQFVEIGAIRGQEIRVYPCLSVVIRG